MCVIAVKPSGVAIPSDELLQQMWNRNSDGAGFMYAHGNDVYIEKGFMTIDELKTALNGFKERYSSVDGKDFPMVFHFRITTHGGTSRENTHPFPISDKDEYLKALDVKAPLGMAHNGIISSVKATDDMSDTMIFIKEVVTPLRKLSKQFTEKYETLLKVAVGSSKLAFLEGNGQIHMVGDFKEEDGMFFSNLYHKPAKVTTYDYLKGYWGGYYDKKDDKKVKVKTSCDSEEISLIVGKLYRIKKEHSYRYSHLADKDLKYVATTYYSHKFEVIGSYWGAKYEIYLDADVVEPKVVEALPYTPHKKKDNIGGAKNEETFGLKQSGNHKFYQKVTLNLSLFEIPVGWNIGIYDDTEYQATVKKEDTWFLDDNYQIYYKDKHGVYYELHCVDTVFTSADEVFFPGIGFDMALDEYYGVPVMVYKVE